MQLSRRVRPIVAVALVGALIAGCGDDTDTSSTTSAMTASSAVTASSSGASASSAASSVPSSVSETSATTGTAAANPDATPLTAETTLKVGYIAALSLAPTFLADKLGMYTAEKIRVEWQPVAAIADALTMLAQGDLDVYAGSPAAPMFNQVSAGLDVRMVASEGGVGVPDPFPAASGVLVRQALLDTGEIKTVADLKGRKIGCIGTAGSATSFLIDRVLATGGLSLSDVELVPLPMAEILTALQNGGVDAGFLSAPFTEQAQADKIATPIVDAKQAYGDTLTSALLMGPNLLHKNRAAGVAFVRANLRAVERLQGDYRTDAEVVTALAQFMKVDEAVIKNGPIYAFDPTMVPSASTVTTMQERFLALPSVLTYSTPLSIDQLIDAEIQRQALATVG